jgi:hypothetical protein
VQTAICDPAAFYPLRRLVSGRMETLDDLPAIEQFIRTVVLHDEIVMDLTPSASSRDEEAEWSEEERQAGGRLVICGIGPTLNGYDFFNQERSKPVPAVELSPAMVQIASQHANAAEGNVYFKAHIDHLKRALGTVAQGGSVLMRGDFVQEAIATTQRYPDELFCHLDQEWRRFAEDAQREAFRFVVPPILGIVLRRCSSRQEIPAVIEEIRNEWTGPRRKVWTCINALRGSKTIKEAEEIRRELSDASRLFAPTEAKPRSSPIRILWEFFWSGAFAGAVAGQISEGKPIRGAIAVTISRAMQEFGPEFGRTLFGRGAFDLANTIRRESGRVKYDELSRLLTHVEKCRLGLG